MLTMKPFNYKASSLICLIILMFSGCCFGQDEESELIAGLMKSTVKQLVVNLDPIYLPALPTFSFTRGDQVDLAISFTEVNCTGLSNIEFQGLTPIDINKPKYHEVILNFPQLLLRANQYSAGGHILNLPFTGESSMMVSFENLEGKFGIEIDLGDKTICAINGSTTYKMELKKQTVNFDNLNPGTDQGLLVNTMLGAFVPDIIDVIVVNLNGKWHDTIDAFVVGAFNKIFCNTNTTDSFVN